MKQANVTMGNINNEIIETKVRDENGISKYDE